MNRIHIIGRKNSGKTTLIVDLVTHLTSLGYRVGTVKHTHHQHELDTPGKDSFRHRQAGAAAVGILSRDMNAVFWPVQPGENAADRYGQLSPLMASCDLVLVEGHSHAPGIKIEVWRNAASAEPMALADPSITAVVSDDPITGPIDVWPRDDVASLAERLLRLASFPDDQVLRNKKCTTASQLV